MASNNTQMAPSSSSSSWKYEVFLSFSGEETRNCFADHLRDALERNGIIVFRDDKEMNRGGNIEKELFKAIDESLYAVVIISENYASSIWCLKELAKIVERKKVGRMTVFPVFYNVDPSRVRNPMEGFKTAFSKHRESGVNEGHLNSGAIAMEEVGNCTVDPLDISRDVTKVEIDPHDTWRSSLTEAGYLAGWHVHNRSESIVTEEISKTVFEGLMRNLPEVPKFLVGLESPVKEMWRLLEIGSVDVRFVGICGISGIGKTTLARVIYERISSQFDGSCFVPQIGEASGKEIVQRQKYLISKILTDTAANTLNDLGDVCEGIKVLGNRLCMKRVFIVLDDVCRKEQMEALAGSPKWFGNGSRIIITTRNRHLPHLWDNNIYDVEKLNYDDASELFQYNAFIKRQAEHIPENEFRPPKELVGLTHDIVDCADGLPSALEVFGSYLDDKKDENLWKDYVGLLKADLVEDILKKLEINLDGLDKEAREAFKDIACFFNGWYKDLVTSKLKSLRYFSEKVLIDLERKCLIKFSEDKKLFMNDLLARMGIRIAKRSRLCRPKDIISALKKKTGVDEIEGLALKLHLTKEMKLCYDAFSLMKNLKMLHISLNNGLLQLMKWNGDSVELKLSNELCIIEWLGYPLNSFPNGPSSELIGLAELSLRHSHIVQLWDDNQVFWRLKCIDLSFSKKLIEIPNLKGVSNLEILDLSFCEELHTLNNSSIEDLKKLRMLLLQGCCRLQELPSIFSSESLEVLNLSNCSSISRFPNIPCSLQCLTNLDISGTAIKELPPTIMGFSSLKEFRAYETRIGGLPSNIVYWKKIEELSVGCCTSNTTFQLPTFSSLGSLKVLKLSRCSISDEAKPLNLSGLHPLEYLDLSHNTFTKVPDSVCQVSNLHQLLLDGCSNLKELSKTLFSSLRSLSKLSLSNCNLSDNSISKFIGCWSIVSSLDLSRNKFTKLPNSMCELFNLRELILDGCISLQTLPKLPLSLNSIHLRDCPLVETFGSQMTMQNLRDMSQTSFCPSTVAYIGFGKPHKVLYPHPPSPPYMDDHEHWTERVVCGRLGESEIPVEFTQGSISSKTKAEIQMDWDLDGDGPSACALSIVYEVKRESKKRRLNELESLNIGAREDNNHIFPEFVCQLQPTGESPASFVIRVPEGARDGSSYQVGVFIVMRDSIRKPKGKERNISDSSLESEAIKRWRYRASVIASSKNVELQKCGARLLGVDATSSFSQFKSSVCPDEQSLERALDVLLVTGPSGAVSESDQLNGYSEAESVGRKFTKKAFEATVRQKVDEPVLKQKVHGGKLKQKV